MGRVGVTFKNSTLFIKNLLGENERLVIYIKISSPMVCVCIQRAKYTWKSTVGKSYKIDNFWAGFTRTSVHGAVARLHSVPTNVWRAMEYSCVGATSMIHFATFRYLVRYVTLLFWCRDQDNSTSLDYPNRYAIFVRSRWYLRGL